MRHLAVIQALGVLLLATGGLAMTIEVHRQTLSGSPSPPRPRSPPVPKAVVDDGLRQPPMCTPGRAVSPHCGRSGSPQTRLRWDMYKHLLSRYDLDRNNELDIDEVFKLMTDIQHGKEPTDQEVLWVMKGCRMGSTMGPGLEDEDEGEASLEPSAKPGSISVRQMPKLLQRWFRYVDHKPHIEEVVRRFDESATGGLLRDELRAFLCSLEEGVVPTEDEVDCVMTAADFNEDGQVDIFELEHAVNVWYTLRGKKDTDEASALPASFSQFITKAATGTDKKELGPTVGPTVGPTDGPMGEPTVGPTVWPTGGENAAS